MYVSPIPITMKSGSPWRPDFIFEELLDIVDVLALPHYRDAQGGAVEALRLDLASRRGHDNRLAKRRLNFQNMQQKSVPFLHYISRRLVFSYGFRDFQALIACNQAPLACQGTGRAKAKGERHGQTASAGTPARHH